jgi:hypothetical protein
VGSKKNKGDSLCFNKIIMDTAAQIGGQGGHAPHWLPTVVGLMPRAHRVNRL